MRDLPSHIAIIMDGNGRWAKLRDLPRSAGHEVGIKTARTIVKLCAEKSVPYLTLFAFGCENWRRPESEVNFLMDLFIKGLEKEADDLHENNVRLRFIGDQASLSKELQGWIQKVEKLTEKNSGLFLTIALNYSGRWDILSAVNRLIENGEKIQKVDFEQALSTHGIPEPDLLIRTSGEQRISNFMLWQCAYSELYFTDILWPDFDHAALEEALNVFSSRQRRFGKTPEQVPEQV